MLLDLLPLKNKKNGAAFACTVLLAAIAFQLLTDAPKSDWIVSGEQQDLYYVHDSSILGFKADSDMYAPQITLIKSAPVINASECGNIPFTYTITNQSTNGESFVNVVITDNDFGGIIAGPDPSNFSGDLPLISPDGILSPGETWTFNFAYAITQNDLENGFFGEFSAEVSADVQGQGITVNDFSHPSDPNDDAPTVVDLTACQNASIGLIMGWQYIDLDADACYENYLFTYTVRNTGMLNLHNITLEDQLFGSIPGPVIGSDPEEDGILAPGEQWQYLSLHSADLNQSGSVDNQATVFAESVAQGNQVSDLSDNDGQIQEWGQATFGSGQDKDDPTTAPYDQVCGESFARIGLIKTASPLDTNNDGCPETILYTFSLQNVGDVGIEEVEFTDKDLLGVGAPTLVNNGNGDAILDPGEVWGYEAQYAVTAQDLVNGVVSNQAVAKGKLVGFGLFLFDNSDDNSFDEDDSTLEQTEGYCAPPAIGLIKESFGGDFLVDLDNNGCVETIHYSFVVTNTGGMDLQNIVLTDLTMMDLQISEPTEVGVNDGILSVGETWTYDAFYPLTQQDIDDEQVSNQAEVVARTVLTDVSVSDLSDHSNFDEDRETIASTIGGGICPAESGIQLTKSIGGSGFQDVNGDGCVETLVYTFVVENTGTIPLDNIVLTDAKLGGEITAVPQSNLIGDNDQVLVVGEIWTYQVPYPLAQADVDLGSVTNQANVLANEQGTANEVSDMKEITTPLGIGFCPAVSGIQLSKSIGGSGFQDANSDGCIETLVYTFIMENTGTIPLDNIVLTDAKLGGQITEVPQSNLIIGGNDQVLAVGEIWTYQVPYLLTQPDVDLGSVTNQANVLANEQGTANEVSDMKEITTPLGAGFCSAVSIQLTKSIGFITGFQDANNDGCVETLVYTLVVENTGILPLENIVLTDAKLGGQITVVPQSSNNGDNDQILEMGETWTYQVPYLLTQADVDLGSVTNQAEVVALEPINNSQVSDMDEITTPLGAGFCPAISIQLTKAVDSFVDQDGNGCNEIIRYSFTVENTGDFDLTNIVLSDNNLGGQVNNPQGDVGNDQVLSVGEIWTYLDDYPLVQNDIDTGSVTNTADVSALEPINNVQVMDQMQINTPLSVNECVPLAGIALTKAVDSFVDQDGNGCNEILRYSFTVENTGDFNLTNIVLSDNNLGGQVNTVPVSNMDNDQTLAVGEIWTYLADYPLVQNDIDTGSVTNTADVSALEPINNLQVTDQMQINTPLSVNECAPMASIQLIKTLIGPGWEDTNNDGCFETLAYTFIVENTGSEPLRNVVLNDPDLGGKITVQPQGDTNNDEVLSVGEIWIYEVTYLITQADIDFGSVSNQANVTAEVENTNNSVTDTDEISLQLDNNFCAAAGIELTKVGVLEDLDGNNCPESIHYTFTVTNTGVVDLSQVALSDADLTVLISGPLDDTGSDQKLSSGESWTYEAIYPITQADIDGITVTNQASVTAIESTTNTMVSDSSEVVNTDVSGACIAEAAIGLIKIAGSELVDVDRNGCPESISYTFTVKNTGAISLEQVVLNDIKLGPGSIEGPLPGNDINGDTFLSVGETWTYQALYPISEQDSIAGEVRNQAQVSAIEQNTMNSITDDSDDNSFEEDEETITSVQGACVARGAIELIKSGVVVDRDGDNCEDSILYTFTVENTGAINLYQILLEDDLLDQANITGPLSGTDANNDSVLSVNKVWTFEAYYSITKQDLVDAEVTNIASVSALEVISNNSVSDDSEEIVLQLIDVCANPVNPIDTDFEIFNGITPNGDGINDYFQIDGIENYPDNILRIFNRWGVLVYEVEGYGSGSSLFRGHSDGRATIAKERELPSGTYFYMLTFMGNNPGEESYSGYLYINRD